MIHAARCVPTFIEITEITEITERRKDTPQPPYATFINFLLKVVIKNQLFQCFFYLCDTLRINNMDKSFYISININNMGGGSPFSSSSAFIHPYGQRRLSAPLVRRAAFLFYQLTINLV